MVVFRDHEQQSVGTRNSGRKPWVLEGFTCIVKSEAEVAQINKLRFDTLAFLYFVKHKVGDIFTRSTFSRGAKDYRDEEWSIGHQVLQWNFGLWISKLRISCDQTGVSSRRLTGRSCSHMPLQLKIRNSKSAIPPWFRLRCSHSPRRVKPVLAPGKKADRISPGICPARPGPTPMP